MHESPGRGKDEPRAGIDFKLVLFALIALAGSAAFSRLFVVGHQSTTVEIFAVVVLPLLSLWGQLMLVEFFPFAAFCAAMALDLLLFFSVVTYRAYYRDNLDIHILIQNWREGLSVADYVATLAPWRFVALAAVMAIVKCGLARDLGRHGVDRRLLALLSAILLPCYAFALYREPLRRAALAQDYALAIKLYGYYGAMAGDLVFSGVVPTQAEMLKRLEETQARIGTSRVDTCVPSARERNVLFLQVESLDFRVVDAQVQGRPVTPFLSSLKGRSYLFPAESGYTPASSSSGADFQVLTGLQPDPGFPAYTLNLLDYKEALPNFLAGFGRESFAFVGVAPNFFSQGRGFQRAGFKKHYDESAYPSSKSRWGIDDETFFATNLPVLNKHVDPAFYLMITLTSHGPFNFVEHKEFVGDDPAFPYFNAINYTDHAIESFLTHLTGSYVVIIYGDHTAHVRTPTYSSSIDRADLVPALVFQLDGGAISRPVIVSPPSGKPVRLASLYWWIRNSVAGPCPSVP